MVSNAVALLDEKYEFYQEAITACNDIDAEPIGAVYENKSDFFKEIHSIRAHKNITFARMEQLLSNAGKKLHDSAYDVWGACIHSKLLICDFVVNEYTGFVGNNLSKLPDLVKANADSGRQCRNELQNLHARFQILGKTPPALENYITAEWETSFADMRMLRDDITEFSCKVAGWNAILEDNQRKRQQDKDQRESKWIRRLKIAGAAIGGGALVAVPQYWDAIIAACRALGGC